MAITTYSRPRSIPVRRVYVTAEFADGSTRRYTIDADSLTEQIEDLDRDHLRDEFGELRRLDPPRIHLEISGTLPSGPEESKNGV